MAKLRTLSQVPQVRIGEDDVLRGFVDVECGTHVELRSNSRCRVAFASSGRWFNGVQVYGFPRVIVFGSDGGTFVRPLERHRTATYRLSYRFQLHPLTEPGAYDWPLHMRLSADFDEAPPHAMQGARRLPPTLHA